MAVCQTCGREGCIACMCACRIAGRSASRPVCGKYRIAVSLREGFPLSNAKKRIAEQSMLCHLSEFPISHRSVISSMGTLPVRPWKMRVFSDQYSLNMRGRLFRKRFAAWTCRFQKRFAHFFVPIEEWTHDGNLPKGMYGWNFQFKPYLLSFKHSCVRTFKNSMPFLGLAVSLFITHSLTLYAPNVFNRKDKATLIGSA